MREGAARRWLAPREEGSRCQWLRATGRDGARKTERGSLGHDGQALERGKLERGQRTCQGTRVGYPADPGVSVDGLHHRYDWRAAA